MAEWIIVIMLLIICVLVIMYKYKLNAAVQKKDIFFRSQPNELSSDQAKAMIKKQKFYDFACNKSGPGFNNQYELQTIDGDKVVIDHASGLMWQQGGSDNEMKFESVNIWLADLNRRGYAGYHNWRLPTLEEAMSLMEPKKKHGDLYIDSKFDPKQMYIWTSDKVPGMWRVWYVSFGGMAHFTTPNNSESVRAVRSVQSYA